jgi:uncharacterized Fe-S cluster protein YjdI
MSDARLQVYENADVRVTFDPGVCRHSGVCLRTLPPVFDVRRKRWIDVDAAGASEIFEAVAKCPSGALRAQLITSVYPTMPPKDTE